MHCAILSMCAFRCLRFSADIFRCPLLSCNRLVFKRSARPFLHLSSTAKQRNPHRNCKPLTEDVFQIGINRHFASNRRDSKSQLNSQLAIKSVTLSPNVLSVTPTFKSFWTSSVDVHLFKRAADVAIHFKVIKSTPRDSPRQLNLNNKAVALLCTRELEQEINASTIANVSWNSYLVFRPAATRPQR